MKTNLFIFLFAFLAYMAAQSASAQVLPRTTASKAGSWQIGLRDGYGNGNLLQHRNSLQPFVGYYLTNRFVAGATASWSKEWVGKIGVHDLTLGPSARYFFTNTRLAPFLEATYQFGQRSVAENAGISYPSVSMQFSQISPGLSLGVSKSLRIELNYAFQWLHFSRSSQYYGQPQAGIMYVFLKD
ncbi:hypothetical protein GCM10027592_25510 [Spirosoma flavus]